MENKIVQKLNTDLSYDPEILVLNIWSKESELDPEELIAQSCSMKYYLQ